MFALIYYRPIADSLDTLSNPTNIAQKYIFSSVTLPWTFSYENIPALCVCICVCVFVSRSRVKESEKESK